MLFKAANARAPGARCTISSIRLYAIKSDRGSGPDPRRAGFWVEIREGTKQSEIERTVREITRFEMSLIYSSSQFAWK